MATITKIKITPREDYLNRRVHFIQFTAMGKLSNCTKLMEFYTAVKEMITGEHLLAIVNETKTTNRRWWFAVECSVAEIYDMLYFFNDGEFEKFITIRFPDSFEGNQIFEAYDTMGV